MNIHCRELLVGIAAAAIVAALPIAETIAEPWPAMLAGPIPDPHAATGATLDAWVRIFGFVRVPGQSDAALRAQIYDTIIAPPRTRLVGAA